MSVTLFQLNKSDLVNTSHSAAGRLALRSGYGWQLVADKLCACDGPLLYEYDSPHSPSVASVLRSLDEQTPDALWRPRCTSHVLIVLFCVRLPGPSGTETRALGWVCGLAGGHAVPVSGSPPPPPASSLASRRSCTQTAVSSGSGVTRGWGVSKHIPTSGVWTPACLGVRRSRWPLPTTEESAVPSPDLSRAVPPAVALSL